MKRVQQDNINTKEYFEAMYSKPNWRDGWDGSDKRIIETMKFIHKEYRKHLDIGCADGTFTKLYLEKFPHTKGYGVDIAESVISIARENCTHGEFTKADAYVLPFKDYTFNMVHCAEVLEHLDNPEKAITEAHRVLKTGGEYIITVPNEYAADFIEHLWSWSLKDVCKMIEKAGFEMTNKLESFDNGCVMYIVGRKK